MSFSSSSAVYSSNAFLNPGPAPAPPDQSKLSKPISPIDNLNQYPPPPLPQQKRLNDHSSTSSKYNHSPSGSDSSYNESNSTTSPTSISTAASSISNNPTPSQRDDPKGRFIKHGWIVNKEDGSFKMWNRKYLVLRESHLDFYKNEVTILHPPFLPRFI